MCNQFGKNGKTKWNHSFMDLKDRLELRQSGFEGQVKLIHYGFEGHVELI